VSNSESRRRWWWQPEPEPIRLAPGEPRIVDANDPALGEWKPMYAARIRVALPPHTRTPSKNDLWKSDGPHGGKFDVITNTDDVLAIRACPIRGTISLPGLLVCSFAGVSTAIAIATTAGSVGAGVIVGVVVAGIASMVFDLSKFDDRSADIGTLTLDFARGIVRQDAAGGTTEIALHQVRHVVVRLYVSTAFASAVPPTGYGAQISLAASDSELPLLNVASTPETSWPTALALAGRLARAGKLPVRVKRSGAEVPVPVRPGSAWPFLMLAILHTAAPFLRIEPREPDDTVLLFVFAGVWWVTFFVALANARVQRARSTENPLVAMVDAFGEPDTPAGAPSEESTPA
jgi:hypothetical protein